MLCDPTLIIWPLMTLMTLTLPLLFNPPSLATTLEIPTLPLPNAPGIFRLNATAILALPLGVPLGAIFKISTPLQPGVREGLLSLRFLRSTRYKPSLWSQSRSVLNGRLTLRVP